MKKLRVLDLFSGIGGFSLGLERTGGFETVAFCEIDPFCQAVLRKHWPDVPIFEDVKELTADAVGNVDIITGGYPCQPFSFAGKRQGAEDDRHLWPEMYRLVAALRPTWVIGENVFGHISMGLDEVLSDLEREGYASRAFVIPACAVDAPHRRDRIWVVGNANFNGKPVSPFNDEAQELQELVADAEHSGGKERHAKPRVTNAAGEAIDALSRSEIVADAVSPRQSDSRGGKTCAWCDRQRTASDTGCRNGGGVNWCPEPDVGRVANGVPRRVDRLRSLGNAVVPQIPEMIGQAILATYKTPDKTSTDSEDGV